MASGISPCDGYKVIVDNATLSGTNYELTKDYTVSGDGIVVVFASSFCSANDWGYYRCRIYLNGNLVAASGQRFVTENSGEMGMWGGCPIEVQDGDVVRINLRNSKEGSKTFYRRFLCIGDCSVS